MLTGAPQLMMFLVSVATQNFSEPIVSCDKGPKLKCMRIVPKISFKVICKPGFLVAVYELTEYLQLEGKVTLIMCLYAGKSEDCRMRGPLNTFNQSFDFRCHAGAVWTGITYDYDPKAEDGIFHAQCCKFRSRKVANCERWGERTYMAQYMRASSVGYKGFFPFPAISGFTSRFYVREYADRNFLTRQFTIDMCILK
ncbi:unnamed protein product [Lymnaea stagnalis]|uniref:MD-2-related lipid-recognition domain-containing protein n=1 Tax=Lymnaea stagnalis TaxID=6523 RepID=A0AAV2IBY8_LYMST